MEGSTVYLLPEVNIEFVQHSSGLDKTGTCELFIPELFNKYYKTKTDTDNKTIIPDITNNLRILQLILYGNLLYIAAFFIIIFY